jgi:hypothetical protein
MTPTESKDFWKKLKTTKNDRNKNDEDDSPDLNLFANHCKSQGNPEKIYTVFQNSIFHNLNKAEKLLTEKETDNPITISEIKSQIKKKWKVGRVVDEIKFV